MILAGFFENANAKGNQEFQKLASSLSDDFRFAHTFNKDVQAKYSYSE